MYDMYVVCVLEFLTDLKYFAEEISSLLKCMGGASENHQFEWVDSVLVKALEYGHWLLISHANFCRYVYRRM